MATPALRLKNRAGHEAMMRFLFRTCELYDQDGPRRATKSLASEWPLLAHSGHPNMRNYPIVMRDSVPPVVAFLQVRTSSKGFLELTNGVGKMRVSLKGGPL